MTRRSGRTRRRTAARATSRDAAPGRRQADRGCRTASAPHRPAAAARRPVPATCRGSLTARDLDRSVRMNWRTYRHSLHSDVIKLLSRYRLEDLALKVVGVGSVGTRCFIGVFTGRDEDDVLFLQVKEAGRSVLEPYLKRSRYKHQGERVVAGQRLTQSASDIFLGWSNGPEGGAFYWRQLRDWKGSVNTDTMDQAAPARLRGAVRMDAGQGPCAFGRPGGDRRLPGQEGPVRHRDGRLRRGVRGAERTGLRGDEEGGRGRPHRGRRGLLEDAAGDAGPGHLRPGGLVRGQRCRAGRGRRAP